MSYACIKEYHGEPAIMIDGVAYPPMGMTTHIQRPDYLKNLGESGVKLFFLPSVTRWFSPEKRWTDENGTEHIEPSGIEQFKKDAEMLLAAVPDAYIFIRLYMNPPLDWIKAHPDDIMRYNDGSNKEAILASNDKLYTLPGMYSLCSEAFREDCDKALTEYFDEIDSLPYADRIAGFFLGAGGTNEWYPINPLTDYNNDIYADFCPAFRKEYSGFLRKKYGSEDALRLAWKKPDASFDDPIIPDIDSRLYTHVDDVILDAMLHYESAARIIGKKIEINPENSANLGVFLNANEYSYVADFYHAWHQGTANTIIHLATTIKNRYKGKLVGAFYGSYGCTDFFDLSTAEATLPIMDSGVVDFLAAPGVYNNREPGGYVAQREMNDSFRLRGQIYIAEEDSRTHREDDFYRGAMGLYTIKDTITTLKRDFARNLCEETYGWWMDQHEGGGRYMEEGIYTLLKRQNEIAQFAYSLDRTKENEIALIYDQESIHYVSQNTNALMLDYYRTSDLGRIGAPVDYYFHNDMANPNMPDYKMYLMINVFYLTNTEREAIHRKAARNGATVVWLYAPGFINPEAAVRMGNENITQLTGISIGRIDQTRSPSFRVIEESHPALRYADRDRLYGMIDRDVHSNIWLGTVLTPPYMNPAFYIDDRDAVVLGRYCIDGKAALAIKETDGFTSIYCAPQILRSELIASFAEYSGCHLYSHTDDCIYASKNFVTIHAHFSGRHTVYFPRECSPYEVYECRFYGRNVDRVELDMHLGETLMFSLSGEC
ncbi:MAG: hypothetical protein ACERKO_01740 [Acetanaerobacterium sp.]